MLLHDVCMLLCSACVPSFIYPALYQLINYVKLKCTFDDRLHLSLLALEGSGAFNNNHNSVTQVAATDRKKNNLFWSLQAGKTIQLYTVM